MRSFVKQALFVAMATLGAFQVGCTERDVAAGAAGVVLGAILVDSQRPVVVEHRGPSCRMRETERCGYYPTYGGGSRYRCVVDRVDTCGRRYRKIGPQQAEVSIADVANFYKLQPASAERVLNALDLAAKAQSDEEARAAFASIGVNNFEDAKALANGGSPSEAMVASVGQNLDQGAQEARMMLTSIAATARAQQEARQNGNNN